MTGNSSKASPSTGKAKDSDTVSRETDDKPAVDYPGLKGTDADRPAGLDNDDERDATIRRLRAEVEELRHADSGAETRKALAALAAEVERMKSGVGLVPLPDGGEPDPYLYWGRLGNGDVIEMQHPHATHHHTASHGLVPVRDVWLKDPDHKLAL